jgi:hypothetical protein
MQVAGLDDLQADDITSLDEASMKSQHLVVETR